ncbi:hypothetical protein X975_13155, partial [Stegodyphus mimosarum]
MLHAAAMNQKFPNHTLKKLERQYMKQQVYAGGLLYFTTMSM